ncbi:uncharacterized protein LOC129716948 [Wyeomyia smithii]|uniref:uncharacterized protein LOC129716948 n=1 Tax=Wyeomyia smithii TaxID=174621 RepID=UPI0024680426|nr:uncharacterized protein LOC129716948 [Wyeomyia smithii]
MATSRKGELAKNSTNPCRRCRSYPIERKKSLKEIILPSPIFALRSSFTDTVRIVALLLRFKFNCTHKQGRRLGFLTCQEKEEALSALISLAQREWFVEDIDEIQRTGEVKTTSRHKSLAPRLVNGLLLVGGRLRNARIAASRMHPIILALTTMLVTYYHQKLLHAGPQLVLASIRERYWPLSARSMVRKVIHRCMQCYRAKPKSHEQLMGDLPTERVTPAPPFQRVGVDYCGPFQTRYPYQKGKPIKCFIAVFVCLVVKAIHLEVVADLTTQSFFDALKRFVSRRGRPEIIMCDNATNSVGARRELDKLRMLFNNQNFARTVSQEAAMDNIQYKFIPPKTPNFGDLWEAAVKAMKGHLKRTLGNAVITYEEMCTLTAQIEACLNSRPLTPLSSDPNDLEILTPGHFLVHRPLTAIPEPSLEDLKDTRLSRWQRVQNYLQHIWRRWSTQYLSELNSRTKWTMQRNNLFVGAMVLRREDNIPPLKWRMGRVIDAHTGQDGNIRVMKVRTKDGIYVRGITKVCILPIADNVDQ